MLLLKITSEISDLFGTEEHRCFSVYPPPICGRACDPKDCFSPAHSPLLQIHLRKCEGLSVQSAIIFPIFNVAKRFIVLNHGRAAEGSDANYIGVQGHVEIRLDQFMSGELDQ